MKKLLAFIVAAILCLTCFAACGNNDKTPVNNESTPTQVVYDVEDAAAYLKNMYKKYLTETETAADYTLVSQVMKGGVVYKVTWTTDREDIKVIADEANKQVTIDLNEKTKVDIAYKLTATITDPEGKTSTLTFELKVPKYVLSSWDEYMAMEAGKAVVVEGYIAAVHAPSEGNKYNTLYLHDVNNKGGYYIYSMADSKDLVKDLGLKKGMLVSVTGTKDIYSGTHEIKDASVNVLDTNVVDLTPLDITATYKAATSLKDKALTDKLGMLVTIKGVEITDQDLAEKSMYMNFRLAGLTSYLRVYATDCPVSVTDKGQQSIITEHGKKKGYSADVTGVVVMYSGAIYLNPVSDTPFKYGKKIERTPAQMVELEMDEVKFDKDIALDKTIELPSKGKTYEDVVITWASNSDAIVIEDGKAKIKLQAEATKASITGTFTLGTVVKTKTIEFNLAKKSAVTAQIAANPVPGTAYKFFLTQGNLGKILYFSGEIVRDYYGSTTENPNEAVDVYLEEATGGYYLTFTKGGTKKYLTIVSAEVSGSTKYNVAITTDKPANVFTLDSSIENAPILTIGEQKLFIGTYDTFDTLSASKYSYIASGNFVAHLGTVVDTSTIKPADKIASEKNTLKVEDEFFANAEIDLAVKGSIYDDVTITWASSNTTAAAVNGGKLTITLGDEEQTVTLTATLTLGTLTDTKTFEIKIAASGYTITPNKTLNELGKAQGTGKYTSEVYYAAGVITDIASTKYGNLTIVDEFGDTLYTYGLYDSTGAIRYDSLAVKPQVGDYIIIMSTVGNHNDNPQMKESKLMEHIAATSITDANTIGAAQPNKGDATTEMYLVTGKITAITQTKYGNGTITDAAGNTLTVYGMYNSEGNKDIKYEALDPKPVVGDTVTLYGVLSNYNGAQIKDARIYGYVPAPEGDDDQGGSTPTGSLAATFTLGTDDSSKTNEANQDGTEATSYTETNNGYTLSLTGMTKAYKNSYDAKGNACLKLGTSSVAGTFTFTVPNDVTSVKLYIAGYKSNIGKFTINGGATQSTTKKSANGEYDVITIDTSSTKTIAFTTVSGGWRVKMSTIEFYK